MHGKGGWTQQAELTPADGQIHDFFGAAVALSGDTAVVGASEFTSGAGAAYVFVRGNGRWSQQAKLMATNGVSDRFGVAVALSGDTAVIGAPGNSTVAGAAYVFVRNTGAWTQQATLTAAGTPYRQFGYAVALGGNTAVIGAWTPTSDAGAAYVFARTSGGGAQPWSQQAALTAADGAPSGQFGYAVALSGNTAVVGAPNDNLGSGAAHIFVREGAAQGDHTARSPL